MKLADIPQSLIDAVLSIEDRKFYEHNGVDFAGTIRALFKNVDAGSDRAGRVDDHRAARQEHASASGRKRDLKTKAREAVLAIGLEKRAHARARSSRTT